MITVAGVFVFYLLFGFLLIFLTRRQSVTLTRTQILLVFAFKVALGCLYGYIFGTYYGGDDTWAIHSNSLREWDLLKEDTNQFFREYTPGTALRNGRDFLQVFAFYLADLEYCLLTKTMGIFNLVSRGNYFINVVFFNFIVFWGHYWLFQLAVKYFPAKRTLFLLCIFYLPTSVFWLSGLRGDGMLFFFFSLLLFSFDRLLDSGKLLPALFSLVGFAGIVIFRTPVAFLLLPALISWWLIMRFNKIPRIVYVGVYGIFILLFFASSFVPGLNGPAHVSDRQAAYFQLTASTRYELNKLNPTVAGYLTVFPQAFVNTFFRPYPLEARGVLQLLSAAGILLFWAIVIFCSLNRQRPSPAHATITWVLLFFGCSLYLLIGYTVPFPGAIVRYKSIGELAILIGVLTWVKPLQRKYYKKL